MIRVLIMLGALLTLGCGSAAAPEVDPHQAAADWFDANREYVAGSVLTAALAYSPALAAVDVDINYLEKQYQSGVRTELRDVERIDAQDGPMFLARLWTLAEFAVHSDHVSGMVEVDFPLELTIQADDGNVEAHPVGGDMELRVSIGRILIEPEDIPVDVVDEEDWDKLRDLMGEVRVSATLSGQPTRNPTWLPRARQGQPVIGAILTHLRLRRL